MEKRFAAGLLSLLLGVGCGAGLEEPADAVEGAARVEAAALGTTVRLAPTDDAHVEQASPAAHFGTSPRLRADLNPAAESYLRFDLSAVSGTLARATLRLYVGDGTADGPRVSTADAAWRESTVTWNNRPAALTTLTDLGAVPAGAWLEVDVTSAVRPGAVVAFKLAPTSSDGLEASTKEASTNRPELVLVLGEAQPPPGSCTEDVSVHQVDVEPFQDTYVNADAPTVNYGFADAMVSDGSPRQEAYLSFRVEPRPGYRVKSAWLRLNATDATTNGPKVYRVGAFSEHTVTYATRPATTSAALSDVGAIAAYSFVQYDVSAAVSEGEVHFGLLPDSTDGVRFTTSERSYASVSLRVTYEATYCARRTPGGATAWVRQYGGAGYEGGSGIAFAPGGEFYLVGYGGDNPWGEFGGQAVIGAALVKYAADGTHLWTRALGDVDPHEVVVTGEGNVFVVGGYADAPDMGTGPLPDAGPRAMGMFVAKYGASGALAWVRGFVPTFSMYEETYLHPYAIATDANGSILITGSLLGDVNLDGGTLRGGSIDEYQMMRPTLFVMSLRWDGAYQWSRDVDVSMSHGVSLATDGAGNVWLGGSSRNGMDFGGGPIAARLDEPFVARFGADGRLQWVRVVSGAGGGVTGIAVPRTADADAFITGVWSGDFRFAGVERSHPSPRGYLGRISASGTERWARQVGNAYETHALELDAQGNAVVLGMAKGETDFGTGPLGREGFEWLPFVATYSPTGEPRWARVFDPNDGLIPAMAVYGLQPLVLMPISGTVFIDRVEWRTRGQYDNLLIRLSP
jgi:hypothetical protein